MRRRGQVAEPADLLAAHAAGGLDPEEAARVQEYVAAHPAARAELDEIARTLAEVRAAEPRLASAEPDWDAMAREIRLACGDEPDGPPPGWRFWRWRATRPAALAAVGGLAIAVAIVALARSHEGTMAPEGDEAATARARADASGAATEVSPDRGDRGDGGDGSDRDDGGDHADDGAPGADALADLSGDELDRLERSLDHDEPEDAFVADLLAAGRADPGSADVAELDPAMAERAAGADPAGAPSDADSDEPAIDAFEPPDDLPIDELADQLPDDAIDAIDRFLAEVHAG